MTNRIFRLVLVTCGFLWASVVFANEKLEATIGYLERFVPPPPVLSNLDEIPENEGLAGAELAIADNATTGRFLNQNYRFESAVVQPDEDFAKAARAILAKTKVLVVNAPAEDLLKLADLPEAKDAILVNAAAPENALRSGRCRANLLHTYPSRSMLSDALAQFAVKKRWTNWVMIQGVRNEDSAMAQSIEKSVAKFRLQLKAKKIWKYDADMRRSAAKEVPLFTQDFPDHDVLVVVDEPGDFARYIPYHTWIPRPIVGAEGLVPKAWSSVVEQHGAAQLQSRFTKKFSRPMRSIDYAAWAGVRTIGEAVTRTKTIAPKALRDYILSAKFELGGFKGRKLTYRSWNGQLRQPIPLVHPRAVVALAPLEGFLHQSNELDTLGLDQPESNCTAFGDG